MKRVKKIIKNNWLVILAIFLGLGIKLFFIIRPFDFILTNLVSDDAFYYFQLAKNILAGNGATVDGVNLTNGFHPLWLVLILPIFKFIPLIFDSLIAPIYALLGLSVILDIGIGVLLVVILSQFTDNKWLKVLGLAFWYFNPVNIYEALSGLETPLSLFLILLLVLIGIKLQQNPKLKLYVWAGVVGGLMMLSRLDNIFYFIFFLVWLLVTHKRDRWEKVLRVGVVATYVVLPWLVWNIIAFQTILPSSGASFTMVQHQLIEQDHGPGLAQKAKAVVYSTYYYTKQVVNQTGMPALFFTILGLFLGWLMVEKAYKHWPKWREWNVVIYIFGGFIANFLLHAAVRWGARSWYFIPFNLFFIIGLTWFLEKSDFKIIKNKIISSVLIILILFSFFITWRQDLKDSQIQQAESYAASQWANDNLPPGTVVGSFNSGVIGYFSKHRVVNLDGLVNNNAYQAMRERRLWKYVKTQVDYFIDFDTYLTYRYKSFLGRQQVKKDLLPIKNITLYSHNKSQSGINIYKIIK